jgi:hypothetical protein
MNSDSSWYSRKFGGQQQPQAQRPPPGYIPGYQPPQQPQQFAPQQQVQQAPQAPPKVTIDNLWGAMQVWRGGKAHKIDAEPCPECGSARYYSRTGEGARRGPPPAPHCFDCGYNGMFQQGMASSWQPG